MLLTKKKLLKDTINFFYNQFNSIMFSIILSTIISMVLKNVFTPKHDLFLLLNDIQNLNLQQILKELSVDQQNILLQIFIVNTTSNILNNLLLVTSILTILHLKSYQISVNITQYINFAKSIIIKLLPLIILIMLFIKLGFLLIIIPGILLTITFSLAPIIIVNEKLTTIKSLYISTKLACSHYNLIAPIILFWLAIKIILLLIINKFTLIPMLIGQILLNISNNLITTLLLIYLYRLNMIVRK